MSKILKMFVLVFLIISMSSCFYKKETNPNNIDEAITPSNTTITMGMVDFDSFNPLTTSSPTVKDVLGFVYEPLFTVDENMKTEGVLAESYSVSNDGKSITVNLKQNVLWHNNSGFVAEDVVYTINQIRNSNSQYNSLFRNITDAVALDNYTVKISFWRATPSPYMLLTFPIIKYGSMSEDSFSPNGTGPYRYENNSLIPFESYHSTKAQISKIKIEEVPDNEKFMSMLNANVFDFASSDSIDITSYTPKSNAKVLSYPSNTLVYVGFNCNSPVFKHPEARRAVFKLIDRKDVASHIYFSNAVASLLPINPQAFFKTDITENLISDKINVSEELENNGWSRDARGTYNLNDSRSLTYFTVNIVVNSESAERVKIAEMLQKDMKESGMIASIIKCSEAEFISRVTNGNYEMFIGETDIPSNNDLTELLGTDYNMFNYSSEEIDVMLWQLGTLSSENDKKPIWESLCHKVIEDAPFAPICYLKKSIVASAIIDECTNPSISGFVRKSEGWKTK